MDLDWMTMPAIILVIGFCTWLNTPQTVTYESCKAYISNEAP